MFLLVECRLPTYKISSSLAVTSDELSNVCDTWDELIHAYTGTSCRNPVALTAVTHRLHPLSTGQCFWNLECATTLVFSRCVVSMKVLIAVTLLMSCLNAVANGFSYCMQGANLCSFK